MVIFGFEFKDLENSAVVKEERFVSQMINVSKKKPVWFSCWQRLQKQERTK